MNKVLEQNLRDCADHYGNLAKELGPSAKAAGWRDETTQFLRFEQLFKIIDPDHNNFSIADVGCAYGALLSAMPADIKNRMGRYDGYDLSSAMVEVARDVHKDEKRARFFDTAKIKEPADYIVESGIFNHHFNTSAPEWTAHIHKTIEHMVESAKKGVAFNIMSNRVDFQEDYIYYADPMKMLEFCLDKFGRNVQLLHDYALYEFTVLIRKPKA